MHAGHDGCVFQLLVLVELGHDVWRQVCVLPLGGCLARYRCRRRWIGRCLSHRFVGCCWGGAWAAGLAAAAGSTARTTPRPASNAAPLAVAFAAVAAAAAAFFDEWLAWPTCLPKERLSWSLPRYDIALATWAVGAGHPPATTIDVAVAERHPVAERHHNNRRCAESKHSGASPETETSAIKIIKK